MYSPDLAGAHFEMSFVHYVLLLVCELLLLLYCSGLYKLVCHLEFPSARTQVALIAPVNNDTFRLCNIHLIVLVEVGLK